MEGQELTFSVVDGLGRVLESYKTAEISKIKSKTEYL